MRVWVRKFLELNIPFVIELFLNFLNSFKKSQYHWDWLNGTQVLAIFKESINSQLYTCTCSTSVPYWYITINLCHLTRSVIPHTHTYTGWMMSKLSGSGTQYLNDALHRGQWCTSMWTKSQPLWVEQWSVFSISVHCMLYYLFPQGCVYLKMESIESANKAYRTVHGGWYNGELPTNQYSSFIAAYTAKT